MINFVFVFITSIIYALSLLAIELLFGIDYTYHPDSITYLEIAKSSINEPLRITSYFGNLFILIVRMLADPYYVIAMNIALYSFTNCLIFVQFNKTKFFNISKINQSSFLVLLILIDPYRAHLSLHILKETLLMGFFCMTIIFRDRVFLLAVWLFAMLSVTARSIILFPLSLIKWLKKIGLNYLFPSILISILIYFYVGENFYDFLKTGQTANMQFRNFDTIPSFQNIDAPFGGILRALTWPLIRITSVMFFFNIVYIVFLYQFFIFIFIFREFPILKNKILYLLVFTCLSILAYAVTGYNSYIRYTHPIMVIMPLLLVVDGNRRRRST